MIQPIINYVMLPARLRDSTGILSTTLLPHVYAVCQRCLGYGLDETASQCIECDGLRVVLVLDRQQVRLRWGTATMRAYTDAQDDQEPGNGESA